MSKLIAIQNNTQNQRDVYQTAYVQCLLAYKSFGDVMVDFTGIDEIPIEGAKVLFGQLLIKDKCGSITCKSLSPRHFVNIAKGITEYYREQFPQGLGSRWGSKIMEPQVEMSDMSNIWSTIQLGDEVTMLLRRTK